MIVIATRRRSLNGFSLGPHLPELTQFARRQLHQVGQLAQQLALEGAVGQCLPQRAGVAGHVGAALGLAQVAAFAGRLHQKTAQRHGVGHEAGEIVLAIGADEAVRVVLGGQEQELEAARVAGQGQGSVQRLAGGAPAGGVAVEAEHHVVGETHQFLHMVLGAGGAQRGHGVGQAVLGQGHHVHVAFGDQCVADVAQRATRLVQTIQFTALVEDRGFGRVEVLGLFVSQHPAAKTDAFPLHIADGEHDAVAEAVVAFFFGAGLVGVVDDQAAFHQQRIGVVGKYSGQAAPALGGIAQAELLGHRARQAPALEVVHRPGGAAQVLAVGVTGFFQHVAQGGLLLALLGGAGLFLW